MRFKKIFMQFKNNFTQSKNVLYNLKQLQNLKTLLRNSKITKLF